MAGGRSSHCHAQRLRRHVVALAVASTFLATSAQAFEAFDGRLQAHGFFESQLRALNADYSEDWDVAQWYMVFNLELEFDLVQDTVGPVDLLSAYVRAEVRYDCIYSRGCGMFRSMNAYGDRSKSLPRRLQKGERVRNAGRIRISNDPDLPDRYSGTNTDPLTPENDPTLSLFANGTGADGFSPRDTCDLSDSLCSIIAGGGGSTMSSPSPIGPGTVPGTSIAAAWPDNDNPFPAIGRSGGYADFRFTAPGAVGLGPWLPKNKFQSNATSSNFGNPFDPRATSYALQASVYNGYVLAVNDDPALGPLFDPITDAPIDPDFLNLVVNAATNGEDLNGNGAIDPGEDINDNLILDAGGLAAVGGGDNPYRPFPLFREDGARDPSGALVGQAQNSGDARGMFIPSLPLARALNKGRLESFEKDYNFSESKRAWNRGSSQRDEKELKEAYLDVELFDNQLWLRIGKQQIVWGKTELFRTTDQFNPVDLGLASLPSLEESRIALWSARGVWSFYEVGPLDDVRLELAFNFDDYQQVDLGACGEAYAPNVTCLLTFGGFAHGIFGFGIAGVEEPPSPWQSLKGWEVGARIEWRYDRFSFALTDFYGYSDLPTLETLSTYTRNVDPHSGRPREIFSVLETRDPKGNVEQVGTQGACLTGRESACLNPKFDLDGNNGIDGIDPTTGNGTLAVNAYEADLNGNGILEPEEDLDKDGFRDLGSEAESLTHASVAQQVFAYTCASTVGFSALDRAACALNILGSKSFLDPASAIQITVGQALGALLAGSPILSELASTGQIIPGFPALPIGPGMGSAGGFVFPFVRLDVDPGDLDFAPVTGVGPGNPSTNGQTTPCSDSSFNGTPTPCGGEGEGIIAQGIPVLGLGPFSFSVGGNVVVSSTLGGTLSPEQEALLGCGPFWGTQCDDSGIDLLTAEGSALFQSWPGVEGTVQGGDITTLWLTNQKVTSPLTGGTVFAQQPGTRDWYFDQTRSHAIGPLCTTGNFGGQLYEYESDPLENDEANGNQDVLPGCRRKWKRSPDDPAFVGFNEVLALNLYGRDLECARERAANNGVEQTPGCAGLGAEDSPRVDPRSWSLVQDGNPDSLGLKHIQLSDGFGIGNFLPPARDIGVGTDTRVPDFFYSPAPGFVGGVFSQQSENPAVGALFDACDEASYPTQVIAEHGGSQFVPCARGGHPMTGQPLASEMAAVSWNFMVLLIQQELQPVLEERRADCPTNPSPICAESDYEFARHIFLDPESCSFVNPALCDTFRTLMGAIGLQRNVRRAGGNGTHGRRTFSWQSGGEVILTYEKRNVLGFSMDFAEDVTKSNFSFEFTWIEGIPVANNNEYDGLDEANDFNLTISADRPTFINFLNSNRTFFFNWQFFMRYREGWKKGFTDEGPWSFLTTFAVGTGYFQDRLTPSALVVYDIRTQSGAFLPSISYRFTQNFSAAVGMAYFFGKPDRIDEPLAGLAPAGNRSRNSLNDLYKVEREGGLAIVRDRDELWAQLRYTF